MRKQMSRFQLAANRHNGTVSTGPKTPGGKAVSKMNALKYGIRAKQTVVQGHKIKESLGEFQELCQEFHQNYAPVSPVEEMLVDQIVDLIWRLRRVQKAETAEIALQADAQILKKETTDPFEFIVWKLARAGLNPSLRVGLLLNFDLQLMRSSAGIDWLMGHLEIVRNNLERDGVLTEETLEQFRGALGGVNMTTKKLEEFRNRFLKNPSQLDQVSLKEVHSKQVGEFLDERIAELKVKLAERTAYEKTQEETRQLATLVLSKEKVENILRYETSLQKKLFRAMHELERLQRRRLGENVPPPQILDISNGA